MSQNTVWCYGKKWEMLRIAESRFYGWNKFLRLVVFCFSRQSWKSRRRKWVSSAHCPCGIRAQYFQSGSIKLSEFCVPSSMQPHLFYACLTLPSINKSVCLFSPNYSVSSLKKSINSQGPAPEWKDLKASSTTTSFVNKTMPAVPVNLFFSECLCSVLFPFCCHRSYLNALALGWA